VLDGTLAAQEVGQRGPERGAQGRLVDALSRRGGSVATTIASDTIANSAVTRDATRPLIVSTP
jgi:hypothetical protein